MPAKTACERVPDVLAELFCHAFARYLTIPGTSTGTCLRLRHRLTFPAIRATCERKGRMDKRSASFPCTPLPALRQRTETIRGLPCQTSDQCAASGSSFPATTACAYSPRPPRACSPCLATATIPMPYRSALPMSLHYIRQQVYRDPLVPAQGTVQEGTPL